MKKGSKSERRLIPLFIAGLVVVVGLLVWVFFFTHVLQPNLKRGWKTLTRESKRILGWEKGEIPPEEKRIREEVILKKMEEVNAQQDWRSLASEYPRPKKIEAPTEEERMEALRNSQEFKEMEKELKEYLKKKEDLFLPEPPIPSLKDAVELKLRNDRAAEKIIERLLATKEKNSQEKPLEENLQLGIKGPLATRKILEKPPPPPVKVKMEVGIEMTLWVLPNGVVDRVIPSVRGDAELEQIAVQYLKQWRFIPIPRDQPQVEQWGVIPIRFKLQ